MIRVRIDDVMCESSDIPPDRATHRFKQIHRWLSQAPDTIVHVPAILVNDIQDYPEVISFLQEEVKEGRIFPQIHGYKHINYEESSEDEITIHLSLCLSWFQDVLGYHPTYWIVPWGSSGTTAMLRVAKRLGLRIEGTNDTITTSKAIQVLKKHDTPLALNGITIMEHWWRKGLKLLKIADIARLGSYQRAVEWDKEHRIGKERLFKDE